MSASERMQKIIALGRERLRLAREGNDFFQSAPQIEPCNNLLMWYLSQFGRVINSDCAKLAFLKEGYEPTDPNSVAEFYKRASLIV